MEGKEEDGMTREIKGYSTPVETQITHKQLKQTELMKQLCLSISKRIGFEPWGDWGFS